MKGYLLFEDGAVFKGECRGDFKETVCEVVFNTSMTGYIEILTDPSYAGQGVVMTYPMIGNYGVEREDFESERLQPLCFIIREISETPSNFRNEGTLNELLREYHIPCLCNVDTRALTKKLRSSGTMIGVITDDISDKGRLYKKIREFRQKNLVESVSAKEKKLYGAENSGAKIALMDYGTKYNIINSLVERNCRVEVCPAFCSAEEVLLGKPDGIMLSNGPGDPAECKFQIEQIKKLCDSGIPIFAICLGHQLMALANGGRTEKMKFGHRGANHPVKFTDIERTFISTQNHGYMVCPEPLPENSEIACINVNDKTVEGLRYKNFPVYTVQFHPEANAGPRDTSFLFDKFLKAVKGGRYE